MSFVGNVVQFQHPDPGSSLRRPALLIQAARAGQSGWRRGSDLPRLLRCETLPQPGAALTRLRLDEDRLNEARKAGRGDYDMQRHILLLIAILAEMREQRRNAPRPVAALLRGAGADRFGMGQAVGLSVL